MSGPGEPLLRAQGLAVTRAGRTVLRDVELTLAAGELVALLGPNGAGKSTLLDALAGGITPAAGTVTRHGRVALALQSPDLARRSVLANVTLALGWWGVPRPQRRARALAALAALGVAELAPRPAAALSGGERRRVHLARVLALAPDVLLLDEPFAGLDGAARAELLADTAGALRAPDRATLVVVHDRAEAWALADRLLVVIDGRLVADGAPGAVLAAPPSPAVARFLGYDGELREDGGVRLTRPPHVMIDPDGPLPARVTRVIPTPDGARVELELDTGRVVAHVGEPPPRPGERLRVRVSGGAWFTASGARTGLTELSSSVDDRDGQPHPHGD